jgi:outer membrane protein OmpA-like peptidoglycan-associated protein
VSVGLRYQFGAVDAPAPLPLPPAPIPPAPIPPAPQPEVATPAPVGPREFIVYFPFDQYVLTTEAQAVIQEAASYAQQGGAASIAVVGHADTSGSAAYNVRLSERRSKAVADALVGLGVAQTALSVDWRGESQPAVPTPDGTKEPLNRRATINIQ